MWQTLPGGPRRANLRTMSMPQTIRHPEAFTDERQAPWVAALWAALLLLAVLGALFG